MPVRDKIYKKRVIPNTLEVQDCKKKLSRTDSLKERSYYLFPTKSYDITKL